MKKIYDTWLYNTPISHRGLHNDVFPENTEPAFLNSISHGFAIETDIQMTLDGVLVCYHDNNLLRGCNIDKDIRTLNYSEIKDLKVFGSEYGILTFEEFLILVDGQVPIMLEIKHQLQKGIEQKVINALKNYKGKLALQSFNPNIVRNLLKLEPSYVAGVLCTREYSPLVPKIVNKMIHNFWFKIYVPFDFLSIRVEDLEVSYKQVKKYKIITWTVKNENDLKLAEKYALNIIFENINDLGKFEK